MTGYKSMHGTSKARGCDHLSQGNFTKMFPDIKIWAEDANVDNQAAAEKIMAAIGAAKGIMHDVNDKSLDNPNLPAAYTFFAQFIDHDITLDTVTDLHGDALEADQIGELANLRSASLDLDSVYGFGPEATPFIYDPVQPGRLLVGNKVNAQDLPRNEVGRALIGDPRNDENLFVSQMHLLFIKFHNLRLMGSTFEKAWRDTKFHYQWLILYDFLKRICDEDIYGYVMREIENNEYPKVTLLDPCGRVRMPVEFSVAAYRFGHSTVRSKYPVNVDFPAVELFDEMFGTLGFGPVPEKLTVDWRFLLDVDPKYRFALSKALDHLLPDELMRLPDPVVGHTATELERSLAFRNLLRGYVLGLPSGQRLAAALQGCGYCIDLAQNLNFPAIKGWNRLDKKLKETLGSHTPLFLYILREAGVIGRNQRLGPVGSAIVLETFGNMLLNCDSILTNSAWRPDIVSMDGTLTLRDLVRYVNTE